MTGRGTGRRGRGAGRTGASSRDTLLAAVALQDHIARTMRIPGGPKTQPSTQPGAEMTLAQHLGLIARPPPLLTESEWSEVQLKARLRQHSTEECPICQEAFKQDPQVLLSCSHVFHKSCLASFERYAKSKCCPLCRAVQYQKKLIQDGAEAHRERCVIKIQAAARGWLARRRVKQLRKHHPPSHPRLKRVWAAERLMETSTRELEDMEQQRGDVDALFAELDQSLALSRALCSQLEGPSTRRLMEKLQIEAVIEENQQLINATTAADADEGVAEGSPGIQLHGGPETGATTATATAAERSADQQGLGTGTDVHGSNIEQVGNGAIDWPQVLKKAKARGVTDCPICMGRLQRRGAAGVAWLSCTHCFHLECITAFEAYELSAGGTPSCPVCRAQYQRRCFQ